jgi:hypothetical protein
MRYTKENFTAEIKKIVDDRLTRGHPVNPMWVVHAFLKSHPLPDDFAEGFWEFAGPAYAREHVRDAIKRYEPRPEKDESLSLPGFEFLQRAYSIKRDDEQVIVPIDQLNDAEIEDKAVEYEHMGDGCYQHADELRQYRRNRRHSA